MKERPNSRRKTLLASIVLIGLFVALPAGMHLQFKQSVTRWKSRMKAQGEKFEIQDHLPPRPDASDNGLPHLLDVASPLSANMSVLELMPPGVEQAPPGKAIPVQLLTRWRARRGGVAQTNVTNVTWAEFSKELARFTYLLGEARTALRKPALDANLDYHAGFTLLLPHLGHYKNVVQWQQASALNNLYTGHLEGALAELEAILGLIDKLESEPLVNSQHSRIAFTHTAASLSWQILQVPGLNDIQLASLQWSWQALEFMDGMERSLLMWRAVEEETIRNCRESQDSFQKVLHGWRGGPPLTPRSATLSDFIEESPRNTREGGEYLVWDWYWSYTDELRLLQIYQVFIESGRRARIEGSFAAARSNTVAGLSRLGYPASPRNSGPSSIVVEGPTVRTIFSKSALGLESTVQRAMSAEALRNLVIAAVALRRFQRQQGRLPAKLSELVPEFLVTVPIDPMDGQALRYRPENKEQFLLYSMGDDGKDDGGNPSRADSGASSSSFPGMTGADWIWPQPVSGEDIRQDNAKLEEERQAKTR